jgi:hypothetical protein
VFIETSDLNQADFKPACYLAINAIARLILFMVSSCISTSIISKILGEVVVPQRAT